MNRQGFRTPDLGWESGVDPDPAGHCSTCRESGTSQGQGSLNRVAASVQGGHCEDAREAGQYWVLGSDSKLA